MVLFRTTGLIWRRAATSTGGDSHESVAKMGSRVSFIRTNHLIVTPGCLLTASHLKKTKTLPLYAEPSMVGSRWDSVSLSTVETLKKKKREEKRVRPSRYPHEMQERPGLASGREH